MSTLKALRYILCEYESNLAIDIDNIIICFSYCLSSFSKNYLLLTSVAVCFADYICLLGFNVCFIVLGHNVMVPACSNGTLTNVLPYRNVMPQTH